MATPAEPRPSATVILAARGPGPAGFDYRLFLVQRSGRSGFMARAHVFPGGVLDPADAAPAWTSLLGGAHDPAADPGAALRLAAVREVFEESGVLLALGTPPPQPDLRGWRTRVHDDAARFLDLCTRHDLRPDLRALHPWARWITPASEPRRYDTRFYVTGLEATPAADHDRVETISSAWMSPGEAVAAFERKEIFLPPPTWCVLRDLCEHRDLDSLLSAARGPRDLRPVQPEMFFEGSSLVLALPGGGARGSARRRIVVEGGTYRMETGGEA